MSNYRLTPKEIGSGYYSIPLYQRLFEWDEERIEQLLNDLASQRENFGTNKAYYIGMLTATHENDLVDGQQRFTVMMLLAIILRGYYAEWQSFVCYNNKPRLKFYARPDDEKYISDIINQLISIDDENIPPYENKKMKNGIVCISKYMQTKFCNDSDRVAFAKYVYENMTFFITKLPKNYNLTALNKYFERMNSTGKNLEGHEIIKVKLLHKLDEDKLFYTKVWNRVSDMDRTLFKTKTYNNETQQALKQRIVSAIKVGNNAHAIFENALINGIRSSEENTGSGNTINSVTKSDQKPENSRKTSEGTHSVLSFSDFLLQCLYYYLESKDIPCGEITSFFNKANIVSTFDLLLNNSNTDDIRMFFEIILRNRILLDVYFIRTLDAEGEIDYDLESPFEESQELEKLKMLEEMIYVNSSNFTHYQWFRELIKFTDKEETVSLESLYNHLKSFDDAQHPSSSIDINSLKYGVIDRYWFWRLDFYIWLHRDKIFTAENEKDSLRFNHAKNVAERYVFKRNRSIEHIAPQTPQQEDTLQLSKEERDSFGNLVMISSQQNSSLSNSIYQEKKARVEAHLEGNRGGSIESLKMLHAFTFNKTWNKTAIQKHEEIMIEFLMNSYPQ